MAMKRQKQKETQVEVIDRKTLLRGVTAALASGHGVGEQISTAAACLGGITGFERFAVLLLNEGDKKLLFTHGAGFKKSASRALKGWTVSLSDEDNLLARVAATGTCEYREDTGTDPPAGTPGNGAFFTAGAAAVLPLSIKGKTVGVLAAGRPAPGPIPEQSRALLQSVSSRISLTIENTLLQKSLSTEAQKLRNARQHIVQAEKFSALGLLIASVAHEINNPLTGIMGYAEALRKMSGAPESQTMVDKILKEADRAKRITRSMLGFARKTNFKKSPVDLEDLLDKTLDALSAEISKNRISVRKYLSSDCVALADADQLLQVFFNVLNNAIQALAEQKQDGVIRIETTREGSLAVVRIRDNGPGIGEESIKNIFLPFFTTKKAGTGTGLGLPIASNIIESHGGRIRAESAAQGGTTFHIQLPAVAGKSARHSSVGVSCSDQGLNILIVDDEAAIRESLRDILTLQGNRVDTAGTGTDALTLLRRGSYDIIICDMKLPDLQSESIYKQMQDMGDTIKKTIFISGDTSSQEAHDFLRTTGAHYLTKPFHPKDLHRKIRDITAPPKKTSNHFAA
ncbi:MAG TPA: hypothetical protein DCO77_10020 [Nitrospiraceae bacterium]|nr:hypothetical protein [Nitrospiraceae bacterium]